MNHAKTYFLPVDTIEHLIRVAKRLSQQRKVEVSEGEAVTYLVQRHQIQLAKRVVEGRHDAKVEKRLIAQRQ